MSYSRAGNNRLGYGGQYGGGYAFVGAPSAPIALLAHVSAINAGAGPVASSAIDTSGATLLVASVSQVVGSPAVVSDSKSNVWVPLTERVAGTLSVQLYYVLAPTVGASHTFTIATANTSMCVAAFSKVAAFDQQNGAGSASTTTQQPGSITPPSANALIVTTLEFVDNTDPGSATISAGFTITDDQAHTIAAVANAMAYQIQTAPAAANPTWSSNGAAERMAAAIASFTHV